MMIIEFEAALEAEAIEQINGFLQSNAAREAPLGRGCDDGDDDILPLPHRTPSFSPTAALRAESVEK